MNHRQGIKILLVFSMFALMLFALGNKVFASDYKYKVMDPKYNPAAEQLIDGTLPALQETKAPLHKNRFDFKTFFAILVLVVFPMYIVSLAFKTYKKVWENVSSRELPELGNIKIRNKEKNKYSDYKSAKPMPRRRLSRHSNIRPAMPVSKTIPDEPQKTHAVDNYLSSPIIKGKNPMLLNSTVFKENKGVCLVEFENKFSLIGYINKDIFLLNQFQAVDTLEIRTRHSETLNGKDRYIVRIGNYKALVEVSDSDMELILEL